ncbi:PspC domain-containing protein [Bacteroides sp.]|uniref:PspC domain-containing protein n=1 Tax=Bacteroides sp. TaxID=29523 RepID=UPI00262A36AE|nr:PspC domain-containing protein [Bacteroides sp.]MDD3038198.1 PspC domain-containing protein [Bacteroides sp.]
MENKKLTRSSNRMIAGVCSGIAEYFGWDITLLRIVYILATFFTAFAGVIIYVILWIVMPEKRPSEGYEDRMNEQLNNKK